MTADESLDIARADEALRLYVKEGGRDVNMIPRSVLYTVARLARQEFRPIDPLVNEARVICAAPSVRPGFKSPWLTGERDGWDRMLMVLKALHRGAELEREKMGKRL